MLSEAMTDPLDVCRVDGCDRKAERWGFDANTDQLCSAHYQRLKRIGDLQVDVPVREKHRGCNRNPDGTQKQCKLSGCTHPATSREFCYMHWSRMRRNKGLPYGHVPAGRLMTYKAKVRARERKAKGA